MTDIDSKMLTKVQALLAKAESTPYPEEAESLIAKAQELMARHSIDEVVAQQRRAGGSKPAVRKLNVEPPYASAKETLLAAIGGANHVRVVSNSGDQVTMIGFDSDLDNVELMFSSLLVQSTAAMLRVPRHEVGSRVKAFRHAFLVSYAVRISQRLEEARAEAERDAVTTHGAALVPVLAKRREEVEEAMREEFPRLRTRNASMSHAGGYAAGKEAANRADIGGRGRIGGGEGRALTG